MLRVGDVMTGVDEFVLGTATLVDAARRMRDLSTGSLHVRDGDGHLQGLLTSLDVVGCVASGTDPASARVEEYAGDHGPTVRADDPLVDAVRTMADQDLDRVVVLDDQRLVGVLRADAARRAVRAPDAGGLSARDDAPPA